MQGDFCDASAIDSTEIAVHHKNLLASLSQVLISMESAMTYHESPADYNASLQALLQVVVSQLMFVLIANPKFVISDVEQ